MNNEIIQKEGLVSVTFGDVDDDGDIDMLMGTFYGEVLLYKNNEIVNIENNVENNITIYPNPTNGIVNIKSVSALKNNVIITDITGKIIHNENYTDKIISINISNSPTGIYIIRISDGKTINTSKIVKR